MATSPLVHDFDNLGKFRFPVYSLEEPIKEATLEEIRLNNDMQPKMQFREEIKTKVYLGDIREQVLPAKKVFTRMNTEYIKNIDIKLIASYF